MSMKVHCDYCDLTFEGNIPPGYAYGEPCKECGRYTQLVDTKRTPPKDEVKSVKASEPDASIPTGKPQNKEKPGGRVQRRPKTT